MLFHILIGIIGTLFIEVTIYAAFKSRAKKKEEQEKANQERQRAFDESRKNKELCSECEEIGEELYAILSETIEKNPSAHLVVYKNLKSEWGYLISVECISGYSSDSGSGYRPIVMSIIVDNRIDATIYVRVGNRYNIGYSGFFLEPLKQNIHFLSHFLKKFIWEFSPLDVI